MASATPTQLTYLLVLDFEATCGGDIGTSKGNQEIIEWPTLLYNLKTGQLEDTFHEYVKPVLRPKLTDFCTELTGIEQSTVDAAETFVPVFERFQQFLKKHNLPSTAESTSDPSPSYAFLTCGEWDLKTMLPAQLAISFPTASSEYALAPFASRINIKKAFGKHYHLRNPSGMAGMLKKLGLELEGRHHSGIDDCRNILRIVRKMKDAGWVPMVQGSV